METPKILRDLAIIVITTIILSISFFYKETQISFIYILISIFIIVLANILAKKFFAYNLETDVKLNFWTIYYYGLRRSSHFKKPLPMLWLPIFTTLVTLGRFVWMPITEFDVSPRPERISRRHGLYRYTEVTEWHMALIAAAGIVMNIFLGIVGYFTGFETFAKLSIFYAVWSIVPLGRLDGAKILFGSRNLWFSLLLVPSAILVWALSIV